MQTFTAMDFIEGLIEKYKKNDRIDLSGIKEEMFIKYNIDLSEQVLKDYWCYSFGKGNRKI
ncbi:hypothetical protein NST62_00725 [Ureibacillus sp. FSL K6-8385]|uniref:Uncharacterized protein n=1 Tax=Ureibacillus terrenus TaxID=118246 RepID=A0A540V5E9_9BACL|nr:hypothetical protein [Ureibacillus terrenus]MED3661189.1 hypothetical protein [Ureibacillus terrenus]MED3764335.1 hypothetical protein [Ureibacillus terrenus]TQE91987.1 hypothetical protein FKZ59_02535 [Ureibacillus terrenus]